MTTYELAEKVTVPAVPARVWQALTAWDRQSEWVIATRTYATDLAGQALGGGLVAFTGLGPIGFRDSMVITEWLPPHLCRVRHTGRVVRGTGSFEVAPEGHSGSIVTWSEQIDMPLGGIGDVMWPVVHSVGSWVLHRSLQRFALWAPRYPQ